MTNVLPIQGSKYEALLDHVCIDCGKALSTEEAETHSCFSIEDEVDEASLCGDIAVLDFS